MLKKVLVVGGAGYIGGAVTDVLLDRKIPFSVYDNLTYEQQYLKPVDFIFGDIRDTNNLKKYLKNYTHIVWLAALVGDGACAIKPDLTKKINQDTVEWLSKNYNGRIIFTSTCSVYGANLKPVTEESLTKPLSVYAQTKFAAEHYLESKNAIIFRLGTAFGISDTYSRTRMDLAINYMTMNAIKHKKLIVMGGKQWRPFGHVKHIGITLVDSLERDIQGIFNFTSQNIQIADVAKAIRKETKCKVEFAGKNFKDERSYFADVRKGWNARLFEKKTKYTIEFGIKEIKNIVLSNRIKNLDLEYYSNERYLLQSIQSYENNPFIQ